MRRIWCLWEIFCSGQGQAGVDFQPIMPPGGAASFSRALLSQFDVVRERLCEVDLLHAEASEAEDKNKIMEQVTSAGFERVASGISAMMKEWLVANGRERLSGLPREERATSSLISHLAKVLMELDKVEEAEMLIREAMEGREKALGPSHPNTLSTINNLAALLYTQRKFSQAEELFRRALSGTKATLGATHPSTLTSINNLARLLCEQRKFAEAEPLLREVLEGRKKELGMQNSLTLQSINQLALLLYAEDKLSDAGGYFNQAYQQSSQALGENHPETVLYKKNLEFYLNMQAIDVSRKNLGE